MSTERVRVVVASDAPVPVAVPPATPIRLVVTPVGFPGPPGDTPNAEDLDLPDISLWFNNALL
jgi:hypothetical protein